LIALDHASAEADGSMAFSFTGSEQTFAVPNGVFSITVDAYGAAGGTGTGRAWFVTVPESPGGLGGRSTAVVAVTPGEELKVLVGGRGGDGSITLDDEANLEISGTSGAPGFNGGGCGTLSLIAATSSGQGEDQVVCGSASLSLAGQRVGAGSVAGGGGGASDVRRGSERLVVAGGGGGGGGAAMSADDLPANTVADPGGAGGGGGGEVGSDGSPGLIGSPGGTGATATAPGSGAGCSTAPSTGAGGSAAGFVGVSDGQPPYRIARSTSAGGGGWFGGGCSEIIGTFGGQGGGGGGSGYGPDAAFETGVRAGDGQVVISWTVGTEPTPPTTPPTTPPSEGPADPPVAPAEPPAAAPVATAPRYVG
jgi:hypothetical protein